jgi:hypothetical protein
MSNRSVIRDAHTYKEMLVRWFVVRRDYPTNNEPPPTPPASLKGPRAARIFDEVERDFNRRA